MELLTSREVALVAAFRRQAAADAARPPASSATPTASPGRQPTLAALFSKQRGEAGPASQEVAQFPVPSTGQTARARLPVPQAAGSFSVQAALAARTKPRSGRRAVAIGAGSRTDLTAQQKVDLCAAIQTAFETDGISKKAAWSKFGTDWRLHPRTVQRMFAAREVWQTQVSKLTEEGRGKPGRLAGVRNGRPAKRAKARQVRRRQPGERGYLGTTDWLRTERQTVKDWGMAQEGMGHRLSMSDLFFGFEAVVAQSVAALEQKQTDEEIFSIEDSKKLKFATDRLASWKKGGRPLEKARFRLMDQTGWRRRVTSRQTMCSQSEEKRRLDAAWRSFDRAVYLISQGDAASLSHLVYEPAQVQTRRAETVLCFTDQVPVWLKVQAGTLLVSEEMLASQHKQSVARQKREKAKPAPAVETDEKADDYKLISGPGSAGDARWGVTLAVRQDFL